MWKLKSVIISLSLSIVLGMSIMSCSNGKSNEKKDYVSMMSKAFDEENFDEALSICNELYEQAIKTGTVYDKLWVAWCYYMICCYSVDKQEMLKYMELYTSKFVGMSDLSSVVRSENKGWYTNAYCCEELIKSAYNANPSLTTEQLSSDGYKVIGFDAFARLVINHGN